MKKKVIGIILVVLIGGLGTFYLYNNKDKDLKNTNVNVAGATHNDLKAEDSKKDGVDKESNTTNDAKEVTSNTSAKKENNENKVDITKASNNGAVSSNSNSNSETTITNSNAQTNNIDTNSNLNNNSNNNNIINTNNTTTQVTNNSTNFMSEVEQLIYNKVNEERAKANLSPLSYNSTLENYARVKSKDMGDRGYFSHNDPEGRYITDKMREDGFSYSAWAENIAYISGNTDANYLATTFMNNWMNSAGHRANILTTNCNSIGIGVYVINGKVYATQEFCK